MKPSEEELASVKAEVRSVIVSCPTGMNANQLLKDYKQCIGRPLPYTKFGYKNIIDFLMSIPDVVQVIRTGCSTLLVPVQSKKISHINQLVSEQRTSKRRSRMSISVLGNRSCYQDIKWNKRISFLSIERDEYLEEEGSESDNFEIVWKNERYDQKINFLSYGPQRNQPKRRPTPVSIEGRSTKKELFETKTSLGRMPKRNSPNMRISSLSECSDSLQRSLSISESDASNLEPVFTSTNIRKSFPEEINSEDSEDSFFESVHPTKYNSQHRQLSPLPIESSTKKDKMIETKSPQISPVRLQMKNNTELNESRNKNQEITISEQHELYLNAFVHGIVLNADKVNDPYKILIEQTKRLPPAQPKKTYLNTSKNETNNDCDLNNPTIINNEPNLTSFKTVLVDDNKNKLYEDNYPDNNSPTPSDSNHSEEQINRYDSSKEETILSSSSDEETLTNELSGVGRGSLYRLKNDSNPIGVTLSNFGRGKNIKMLIKSKDRKIMKTGNDANGMGRGIFLKNFQQKYCV